MAIDEYNVPKEVEACIKSVGGVTIRGSINPFYLSGDFDGDGNLDFAVQVQRASNNGLLMCLSTRHPILLGAGSSVLWPSSTPWRFDAWSIIPKNSPSISHPPGIHRDTILLEVKESASGLLYWNGKNFAWKQLSD
ncbi:hypothetical protein [Terriglobus albidus]|uniref:hypothetical protein n=1 Tax=Terriglobus albidus TaxID=1592106 RepID=UPI0021DFED30|nr:hypothetical protein [Terriglobus albidus]